MFRWHRMATNLIVNCTLNASIPKWSCQANVQPFISACIAHLFKYSSSKELSKASIFFFQFENLSRTLVFTFTSSNLDVLYQPTACGNCNSSTYQRANMHIFSGNAESFTLPLVLFGKMRIQLARWIRKRMSNTCDLILLSVEFSVLQRIAQKFSYFSRIFQSTWF